MDSASSESIPVISGVPWESVLGPSLFLVYINHVSSLPITNGSRLTMYANDILLFKPISSLEDYEDLREHTDAISDCISICYLTMNPSKCKYLIASRKRYHYLPPRDLTLGSCALERVHSYRYLGVLVIFTCTLTWKEHIQQILY